MACCEFGVGSLKPVEVEQALMLRSHCCQEVVIGSVKEAIAAMVGFVDGSADAATFEAATVVQLGRVIVVMIVAAAAVAAISVTVVTEAVAPRSPAVTIAEAVAAAVPSGTGFVATIVVVTAATVSVAAASA